MPEKIRFRSPEEEREQEIAETLTTEGGIFYREEIDPEIKETKRYINILGVELETYATKEDIEAVKKEMVLSEVDQNLLRTIAECYKLRQPLMFEGDPGIGKTFLMKKFVQLIHGKETPILELIGTPRTSELEILGHWAPKGLKDKELTEYSEILKELMEGSEMKKFIEEFNKKLNELNQDFISGKIDQETFQEKFGGLTTAYIDTSRSKIIQATLMAKFIKADTEWEFKEGVLLQAYKGRGEKGNILIVDEFNLIPSNYQQIFLQIGGERGVLSDSVSFWGNSGKTRYERGKDTWICFASNFPEKTPGRGEVVAPMTDRLVWKVITSEEAEMKKEIIRKTAGGRLSKRQQELTRFEPKITPLPVEKRLEWDKVLDEKLGEKIADVVDTLDREFVKHYQDFGDKIKIKGAQKRRVQQFEFSGRNPLRLYSYLDHFQVRNSETGMIDITETLKRAYKRYYLDRLADSETREKIIKLFDTILGLDVTPRKLESIRKSDEVLKSGVKELPPGVVMFEGKIITQKELFDILVKDVSLTEEEKRKKTLEEQERNKREIEQIRFDIEDKISKALEDPNISDSIRSILE